MESNARGTVTPKIFRSRRGALTATWLVGVLGCVSAVHAEPAARTSSSSLGARADVSAPWSASGVYDGYVTNPSFHQGRDYLDYFDGPDTADQVGLVAAELSNGDILAAGLVPNYQSAGTCSNGTALCNIGLVRYTRSGARVAWDDPSGFGFDGNHYLIYPNDALSGYQYIRDVKVHNGTIYVLLDHPDTSHAGLGRQDLTIASFFENGRPRGLISVLGQPGSSGDAEDFYGAQMAFMSNGHLIVTATDYDSTSSYLAVSRLLVSDDGELDQDPSWGSAYAGGSNRIVRYPANVPYTIGYAANQVGFDAQDDFYVAGSEEGQGDSDLLVLKISSLDGDYKHEFGGNGFVSVDFAQGGSDNDYGRGLYVYRDDVYAAAEVAHGCQPGPGVVKLDGASGDVRWTALFAGQDAPCVGLQLGEIPLTMAATAGRIGLAGYVHEIITEGAEYYDPWLAVVDADTGILVSQTWYPVIRWDGNRAGDGVFYSMLGGPNANSAFVAVGNGRDSAQANELGYLTGSFLPSSEVIFASNFDTSSID